MMFNALEDCELLSRFETLARAVRARYVGGLATNRANVEYDDEKEWAVRCLRVPKCRFVLTYDKKGQALHQWFYQLRWPNGVKKPQLIGNVTRLAMISELQAAWALALAFYRSTLEPTDFGVWLLDDRTLMVVDDTRDEPFTLEEANSFGMIYPETFGSIGLGITKADLDEMSHALEDSLAPAITSR